VVAISNHFNEMNGDRMFYTKDHKTIDMFDPFAFLEAKRRTLLHSTWAGLFRDEILPVLPVELLAPLITILWDVPRKNCTRCLGS